LALSGKESTDSGSFPPTKILVPIDGSTNAKRALDVGIKISKTYGAELVVLNVIPTPSILVGAPAGFGMTPTGLESYYEQQENYANHFIEEATAIAKTHGVNARSEVARAANSIVEEIIDVAAREKIQLIVIGTRGLGGFRKLLQGSVSSGVAAHANCNVVVVR
jgi:nucleotide-binding universal stress UspA family protein